MSELYMQDMPDADDDAGGVPGTTPAGDESDEEKDAGSDEA